MAENIQRPTDWENYQDTPWTDQNGQEQIADAKGRWYFYVAPPESGGGGASAFADLTDKASADLPTINTPLSTALGLLAPKASPTFTGTVTIPSGASIAGYLTSDTAASTYAPISTKGTRTFANEAALLASTPDFVGQLAFQIDAGIFWTATVVTVGGWSDYLQAGIVQGDSVVANTQFTGSGAGLSDVPSSVLTGNIPVARIATALTAPGPIGGTTPAAVNATTVTASGAVRCPNGTASLPSLTFGEVDTGIFRPALNRFGFAAAGAEILTGYISGVYLGSGKALGIGNNWFRVGANGLEITTSAAGGTLTSFNLANLTASGTVKAGTYTVGTTPAHVTGAEILISSVTGATVGAAVTTGGGAMLVKAASNGSAWICTAIIIP